MKSKINKSERNWILYDVGNSAFTLLVTTIMPIYFNALASSGGLSEVKYLSYWGYATSISTFLVVLLGPSMGTLSDAKGRKKIFFMISVFIGAIGCIALSLAGHYIAFLALFVLAKAAYSLSLVFYDSMLPDITSEDRMDLVSSLGYAWGYIGSCVPFIGCLLVVFFYESIGISMSTAMVIAFSLVSIWWVILTLPLLKSYKQVHYVDPGQHPIGNAWKRLTHIFSELKQNKKILLFLISFFFFIDGVYTIIDMATAYGSALGFSSASLLLALLLTQIVAFPAAIFFGKLAYKVENYKLIYVCILAYLGISLYAITLAQQYQFWILAFFVGLFQGAIQSLSRSYFTKLIPYEKSGEYFGIYDICGKGAAFIGTFLVSLVTQITQSMNLGVGAISLMFILGLFFFYKTNQI